MGTLNSYLQLAENDYLYAKDMISTGDRLGNYNNVAVTLAQSAEKFLKSVLELVAERSADTLRLMHSHNLRAIYNEVIKYKEFRISARDCKWLGDFYFDARYPGDNFVEVSKADILECVQLLEVLREDAIRINNEICKSREENMTVLKELHAFD